jgi:hypothetical protein
MTCLAGGPSDVSSQNGTGVAGALGEGNAKCQMNVSSRMLVIDPPMQDQEIHCWQSRKYSSDEIGGIASGQAGTCGGD